MKIRCSNVNIGQNKCKSLSPTLNFRTGINIIVLTQPASGPLADFIVVNSAHLGVSKPQFLQFTVTVTHKPCRSTISRLKYLEDSQLCGANEISNSSSFFTFTMIFSFSLNDCVLELELLPAVLILKLSL